MTSRRVGIAALGVLSVLFGSACGRSTLSDRDQRLQQRQSASEVKRKELQNVVGTYRGKLIQPGLERNVELSLEIKDVPQVIEGQVDPMLIPTLTGYLKFVFSEKEYITFGIQKAEFDTKQNSVSLVVSNSEYKDIIISLKRSDQAFTGKWNAPATGSSGDIELKRAAAGSQVGGQELRGEYGGVLSWEKKNGLYQFAHLTLRTTVQPPDGLKTSATLRIIFGNWDSAEYLTYKFDQVQYNPGTGKIVFRSDTADVSFDGVLSNGEISGDWASSYTGRLGPMSFKKDFVPGTGLGELLDALRGTYQGALVNTNPQSALPERAMVSFVTSQDTEKPNGGIKVTGGLRLYLGPFGSLEYMELPFSDVQFNFFTRQLVAKTAGDYRLTLKGEADSRRIAAKLSSDALGEVGYVEVVKQ